MSVLKIYILLVYKKNLFLYEYLQNLFTNSYFMRLFTRSQIIIIIKVCENIEKTVGDKK